MSLDHIDTLLYEELKRNGRASMEELASVVGLSRVAVRSRVARLVDSGSLRVIGIVHPSAQGVRAFAHLSINVRGSARAVGQQIAAIDEFPLVSIVAGRASLIAEVHARDDSSLRELVRRVRVIEHVAHVETAVYTERIKDLYAPPGIMPTTKIDGVDRQILDTLSEDGRASYADIARHTQYSASAIRARVTRLIDHGVVRISTVMAPGMVGLQHMCGFGVRLRGVEAIAAIEALALVSYLSLTMSRWDAIGTVLAPTQAEVVSQFDRIRSIPGVEALQSWTHLEVLKENQHLTAFAALAR
ncbi:MAG TPA: Lrp/AsnC family transcriptional regulator [Acidimicrobiales bacterium]|nr:Lrp/AsnC family transcriptional regulator [Acidimicrobiales bacterium]